MALSAEDIAQVGTMIAEALKGNQSPTPQQPPTENQDKPVTLKDIKDLLTQTSSVQQQQVMAEVFEQRKEQVFAETPEKFDPRDYLRPARDALTQLVAQKMKDFGTAGHADEIAPKTLDDMAAFYKESGLL